MDKTPYHTFHIPVMGIAFTIDSPIKVARFGISSVVSIVEDRLIEMMRKYYYPMLNQEYVPISVHEDDFRARRITDYLNLINTIVQTQVETLRNSAFEAGSEIVKYFEMLSDDHVLKKMYRQMMLLSNLPEKKKLETYLRSQILPGSIDVNIMTKIDRNNHNRVGEVIVDGSDAITALRGYAKSNLSNSAVVFSAGLNPRLFAYLETCKEFDINEDETFTKKIIVKVSDYRSALIQGKYLVKKGIWVSEFRIESGLNCGGHAFATDGYLLGPILEEFKANKDALIATLFEIYSAVLEKKRNRKLSGPPALVFSAQGGIGTHEEDDFLRRQYNLKTTGWGTPFLLVPEATTVDQATLELLCAAQEKDIVLSRNSPLGVRFHYLKGTSGETEKLLRIKSGKPGSPCTEKLLALNTEFTKEPICTASRKYLKLKMAELESLNLPDLEYKKQLEEILAKECLCVGLSNAAAINYKQVFIKNLNAVNICPGPNIVNYSRVVSLQTMVDHIYGRTNIVTRADRPHLFIAELHLYIDFLQEQLQQDSLTDEFAKRRKYYASFYANLKDGIIYYRRLTGIAEKNQGNFSKALYYAEEKLECLDRQYIITSQGG